MPRDAKLLDPKSLLLSEHRKKNERWFEARWRLIDGPKYEAEYRFHETRRWRFDFSWPEIKVAVEIDSAAHKLYWNSYTRDVEKMNEALFLGWQVFRFTGQMIKKDDVEFLENLKEYVNERMLPVREE